jgi:glyoxylase-like metal-dependent hydrolase (beta-lactamase superfamily II)/rhodanese-related sulfurtransferase
VNIVSFVHEGLGNSSYLVGIDGRRALLVDPDRSVQRYLDAARLRGWTIDAVLETHLHADFVSGAHEIASATGATLFLPRDADVHLSHEPVAPGRRFTVEGVEVEALGSPGHTPEHLSYAIRTVNGPPALFSGGSLLVGGAARTDLIAPTMTEQLTRAQFRTLAGAFSGLPNETALYPTHGGGSYCSSGAGSARTSTLGQERATNPMLRFESEDEFAAWFPTTFPAAPAYYFRMRAFNSAGPRLRNEIAMPPPLDPDEFAAGACDGLVVDTRDVEVYSAAHIQDSLHIEFRDAFAVWLGWLVPANTGLLFVADPATLDDVITEALLVGYENFGGWLDGGIDAWRGSGRPVASTEFVDGDVARSYVNAGAELIDVRETNEYTKKHVPNAQHVPLGALGARSLAGKEHDPVVLYCGHGERSSTAASLFERAGRTRIVNVRGGVDALLAGQPGGSR